MTTVESSLDMYLDEYQYWWAQFRSFRAPRSSGANHLSKSYSVRLDRSANSLHGSRKARTHTDVAILVLREPLLETSE